MTLEMVLRVYNNEERKSAKTWKKEPKSVTFESRFASPFPAQ